MSVPASIQKSGRNRSMTKVAITLLVSLMFLSGCGDPDVEHRTLRHRGDPLPSSRPNSENFDERFEGKKDSESNKESSETKDKGIRLCNQSHCVFINHLTITVDGKEKGAATLDDVTKLLREAASPSQSPSETRREISLNNLLKASLLYLGTLSPQPASLEDKAEFLASFIDYFNFNNAIDIPEACYNSQIETIATKCIPDFFPFAQNLFSILGVPR